MVIQNNKINQTYKMFLVSTGLQHTDSLTTKEIPEMHSQWSRYFISFFKEKDMFFHLNDHHVFCIVHHENVNNFLAELRATKICNRSKKGFLFYSHMELNEEESSDLLYFLKR